MRGNGVGFALSLIPELVTQGTKYLNKGLSMNKKAREDAEKETKRRRTVRRNLERLNRKHLAIIKKTRKPLYYT